MTTPRSPGRRPVSERPVRSAMAFECRRRQLCEYEAMEAMYALDNSFVSHDAEVFATLQKMVDSIEVHQTPPCPCRASMTQLLPRRIGWAPPY
jgi:hypothetical protein